jgi:hypothetical protein
MVCKFGGGGAAAVVSFLLFSFCGTFSCVLPLEKVHSLGYLLILVWLLGIIISIKG